MSEIHEPTDIFSARLREAREARGLNQRELAERLGLPPSSIAHFEGGRRGPSVENLIRLARALGVTADFLLGLDAAQPVMDDQLSREFLALGAEDRALVEVMVRTMNRRRQHAGRRSTSS